MHLVIVDVEKWKADKDWYDRRFCESVKNDWIRYYLFASLKVRDLKRVSAVRKYAKETELAVENMRNIDLVIADLPG